MKKLITLVLLGAALLSPTLKAQTDEQKAKRFDSICEVYSGKNMFSGSVLIAKNNKILLSKGYGMANYSYDIPNTPATKFKLASVSKQFTAMAIMILQEKGKLSTDDKLNKYIADYPNGDKITIHHLLTHSSGIQNFTDLPVFDSIMRDQHSHEQIIKLFKHLPLDFEPGSKFNYSNSGYVLLSFIVEKVSGKSYGDYMQEAIFQPLGMKNSGLYSNTTVLKNYAEGYSEGDKGLEHPAYIDMSVPTGAGALYSTVEDLYLWDRALAGGKLVKKATLEKIFTPFKDGYAYGWMIQDFRGHKLQMHRGGIQGFSTVINRFPNEDLTIIILKNVDNYKLFADNKIASAIMLNEKYSLPVERKAIVVDGKIYNKLSGNYELEPGFVMSVTTAENKIYVQATGQPKIELYPESEYKYFSKLVDAQLEFLKDDKGNIQSLNLYQGGQTMNGKKVN
jgi:CubicO group peptidase (beta-lactamase class C family)